jgi:hypothetical protein
MENPKCSFYKRRQYSLGVHSLLVGALVSVTTPCAVTWIQLPLGSLAATPAAWTDPATSSAATVGMAVTPNGGGYWEVTANGQVFSYGDATNYGGVSNLSLNAPIVGMAADPMTGGYWLVAADGGVFAFNAPFYGSMGGMPLNEPVVGMAEAANGAGYWLDASDGGIFAFDAAFHGSTGGATLPAPMVGMATDPATGGYWLVGANGGVFAFSTGFFGSEVLPVPGSDPSDNIPTSPAMQQYCFSSSTALQCDQAALAQLDVGLASEGYGPLMLPADYEQLSLVQQLVAVANAERSMRGLPAEPESSQWDNLAHQGAVSEVDPSGPPNTSWGSNLSVGYARPLAADFAWMYDDGPGSNNLACTPSNPSGCWGHRNNILNSLGPAQMGAGAATTSGGTPVLTELFVADS